MSTELWRDVTCKTMDPLCWQYSSTIGVYCMYDDPDTGSSYRMHTKDPQNRTVLASLVNATLCTSALPKNLQRFNM